MECKSEDSENIERFWRIFNQAFKEANDCEQKFMPRGWTTDMATANFNGLERIYGEDVRNKIKGCEFHFRASVNKHSSMLGEDSAMLKGLANELLLASTKEAYEAAYDNLKSFIDFGGERSKLKEWFIWWHDRRHFIFRAFTRNMLPRSNLAEVIHASWTNRDARGLSLLESVEFDTRDALVLDAQVEALYKNGGGFCEGPTLATLTRRYDEREVDSAARKGQDFLDYGIDTELGGQKRKLPTVDPLGGANPPKKSADSIMKMFLSRSESAANLSDTLKVRKVRKVSQVKEQYHVTSSTSGKKLYEVVITNTPSCTCPDFQKCGSKVLCKHILFIVQIVLSSDNLEQQLTSRHLSDEDLKTLFPNAGDSVDSRYFQESAPAKKRRDFEAILKDHEDFRADQRWLLHMKKSRSAQCTAFPCKKVLPKGTECFSVNGALSVPYNGNKAVQQSFYFCVGKTCIKQHPPWTNIRQPTCFAAEEVISEERKREVADMLGLTVL